MIKANVSRIIVDSARGVTGAGGPVQAIAAPGATQRIVLLAIQVQNATSSANLIYVKFGTTIKWEMGTAAENEGLILSLPPLAWEMPANTALNVDGTGSVRYSFLYYLDTV